MIEIKKYTMLCVVVLGLLFTTMQSCHTMKFEIQNVPHENVIDDTNWFFVFGLFPSREIDVSLKCPSGAAAIKEQTTFANGVISLISIGIVEPRSVWYYCLPGKNSEKKPTALLFKEKSL
ncbi:MAG: hypothetical protein WC539_08710 [Nitrospirota bacterium]